MKKLFNEIEKRMKLLKDEVLINIVTVEYRDYEPKAIEIAKQILRDRGIDYNIADTKTEKDTYKDEDGIENKEVSIPIYIESAQSQVVMKVSTNTKMLLVKKQKTKISL